MEKGDFAASRVTKGIFKDQNEKKFCTSSKLL
jgi:hypothetical protein